MIIIRIQTISDVVPGPTGQGSALNAEYVELLNETKHPCDIGSWYLFPSIDRSKFRGLLPRAPFFFPDDTEVKPGKTVRIHTGRGTPTPSQQPTDFYWNCSNPVWSQRGITTAQLFDAKDQLIYQKPLSLLSDEGESDLPLPVLQAASSALGHWSGQEYAPAIELSWEVPLQPSTANSTPTFASPDALDLYILRRETRFPDLNPLSGPSGPRNSRRGMKPVKFTPDPKLPPDGTLVYETSKFQADKTREEWEGDTLVKTIHQYQVRATAPDRVLWRSIRQESERKTPYADPTPSRMTVHVWDREGLKAGVTYYYTAYVADQGAPDTKKTYRFSRRTQASALATGYHGHNLFRALPQIHQKLDTQTPSPPESVALADRTKGQLQRLLEVFDAHLDLLHGTTEGLRDLHNVQRADSRLLPHLAHLIGWRLKDNLNEQQQRNEIDFAPEVYKTVGTIPLIKAIINRHTGWTAKVKEFSQNVLVSFDPERLETTEGNTTFYLDHVLKPTAAYQTYLQYLEAKDSQPQQARPDPPPPLPAPDKRWHGHVLPDPNSVVPSDPQSQLEMRRKLPPGSLNTADAAAMYRYRTKDIHDTTAYTLDFRDLPQQQQTDQRIDTTGWYNPRTIGIYLTPDVEVEPLVFQETTEQLRTILAQFLPIQVQVVFFIEPNPIEDRYSSMQETETSEIITWEVFESNSLDHRSVKPANPPDTHSRTWWPDSP